MKNERGSALILALLMLSFLMILGGALLTSISLDVAIGTNYRAETQLLYLAEGGIAEARQVLANTAVSPSARLVAAAGPDGVLATANDLDTLINASDDIPLIHGGDRRTGKPLLDTAGAEAGRYFVFLRNDAADGLTNVTDTNQVLRLVSIAVIGNATKVMEVTVMKWRFPRLPAALVFDGSPLTFVPSATADGVSGLDGSAQGDDRHALEVLTAADRASLLALLPDADEVRYPGVGVVAPPPADIGVLAGAPAGTIDPRLTTPSGMERIVDSIAASATDSFNPTFGAAAVVGNLGSSSDQRIVVVHGDCELASITGHGILLVRGRLRLSGNFTWNGLVLVIGQGVIEWTGSGHGQISGNVLVARTRADDRTVGNLLGTPLSSRGAIAVDFSGGSGSSVRVLHPGASLLDLANQKFPYIPIANREF